MRAATRAILVSACVLTCALLGYRSGVAAKASHCPKDCKQDIKSCLALVLTNKACTEGLPRLGEALQAAESGHQRCLRAVDLVLWHVPDDLGHERLRKWAIRLARWRGRGREWPRLRR